MLQLRLSERIYLVGTNGAHGGASTNTSGTVVDDGLLSMWRVYLGGELDYLWFRYLGVRDPRSPVGARRLRMTNQYTVRKCTQFVGFN